MELKDFAKELKAYRQNNTLPQGDVKNALADIYEREWHTHKRWGASTINRSCPSCISDMMKSLCAHWESMQVEFKGVPQAKVVKEEMNIYTALKDIVVDTDGDQEYIYKVNDVKILPSEYARITMMEWGAFKTYCKEQGLSVKGKTKKQLLEELGL